MAHIDLKNDLPGILGLMSYKQSTGQALGQLAEAILRGPSLLSQGEREIIAGVVSYLNDCNFCHRSHAAAAEACLKEGPGYVKKIAEDIDGSDLSAKMKSLLKIAAKVQKDGRSVHAQDVGLAKEAGAKEEEIHDTILIAAAFCMFNRYVDGHGTFAPEEGNPFYVATGERLSSVGYVSTDK